MENEILRKSFKLNNILIDDFMRDNSNFPSFNDNSKILFNNEVNILPIVFFDEKVVLKKLIEHVSKIIPYFVCLEERNEFGLGVQIDFIYIFERYLLTSLLFFLFDLNFSKFICLFS
jgi:hypothetical protein